MNTFSPAAGNQPRHRRWMYLISLWLGISCATDAVALHAAELPLVRIAHGAFNEKITALWVAVVV